MAISFSKTGQGKPRGIQGKQTKSKEKILGFTWIYSSELGHFNGLRRIQTKKFAFATFFALTAPSPRSLAEASGEEIRS
jgi:hypothetical protein